MARRVMGGHLARFASRLSRLSHSRVGNTVLNLMSRVESLGWRTYVSAGEDFYCS